MHTTLYAHTSLSIHLSAGMWLCEKVGSDVGTSVTARRKASYSAHPAQWLTMHQSINQPDVFFGIVASPQPGRSSDHGTLFEVMASPQGYVINQSISSFFGIMASPHGHVMVYVIAYAIASPHGASYI